MNAVGFPGFVLFLVICIAWVAPIAAAIWVVVTLHRIRGSQSEMQHKLNAIEQLLQRR
jgi:hypothetical protein